MPKYVNRHYPPASMAGRTVKNKSSGILVLLDRVFLFELALLDAVIIRNKYRNGNWMTSLSPIIYNSNISLWLFGC